MYQYSSQQISTFFLSSFFFFSASTILNSQTMEATQMPYNWWMDEEIVVYIHNWVLFSHKE
jgi:hypothetical protein